MTAQQLVELLRREPHPKEGGALRDTYGSRASADADRLPPGYAGGRSLGTAIYYLLTPDPFSAMPRLPGDEIFHHCLGDPVEMLLLHEGGRGEIVLLGSV